MRIGELARRTGVTAKTIRYYESIGLLPPPPRTRSGYRDYDAATVDRLAFVRAAQTVGLSLAEIGDVLAIRDSGDTPCDHVLALLYHHGADLDRRIAELHALRDELRRLEAHAAGLSPVGCEPQRICHLIPPAPG